MAEKTLPTDQIEMSLFQHFVVRALLLIATGVLVLIRMHADNYQVRQRDMLDYEKDLFDLTGAIESHLKR